MISLLANWTDILNSEVWQISEDFNGQRHAVINFIASFHFKMSRKLDGVNVIYNNTNRLVNTNAIPEFQSVAVKILACECKSIRVFRVQFHPPRKIVIFRGREGTTGNTSPVRRLSKFGNISKPLKHCYTQEKNCVTSPYNSASEGQCILV